METKTIFLYEEEPYFSNSLNSMAKKNWVLTSMKRCEKDFSFKTVVECTFYKRKISHWRTEYEIDYCYESISKGVKNTTNKLWIIEASSLDEARSIVTKQFSNIAGFQIRNIKEIWSY